MLSSEGRQRRIYFKKTPKTNKEKKFYCRSRVENRNQHVTVGVELETGTNILYILRGELETGTYSISLRRCGKVI
jgi:hypothetical protein